MHVERVLSSKGKKDLERCTIRFFLGEKNSGSAKIANERKPRRRFRRPEKRMAVVDGTGFRPSLITRKTESNWMSNRRCNLEMSSGPKLWKPWDVEGAHRGQKLSTKELRTELLELKQKPPNAMPTVTKENTGGKLW